MNEAEKNKWTHTIETGSLVEKFVTGRLIPSIGAVAWVNNDEVAKDVDLMIEGVEADVKTAFTPYPSTPTPAGLDKMDHLTLDAANIFKYPRHVLLLFIVRYNRSPEIVLTTAGRLQDRILENPKRIYSRRARGRKDKSRKVGVSKQQDCENITHLFPMEVLQEIKRL